jgi:hypothetical protein
VTITVEATGQAEAEGQARHNGMLVTKCFREGETNAELVVPHASPKRLGNGQGREAPVAVAAPDCSGITKTATTVRRLASFATLVGAIAVVAGFGWPTRVDRCMGPPTRPES